MHMAFLATLAPRQTMMSLTELKVLETRTSNSKIDFDVRMLIIRYNLMI